MNHLPIVSVKNFRLYTPNIPSELSVYTHPVTGKLETVSVGSKSGRFRRSSVISITILAVASERFFAERIAKTLVKMSHSGCPGFCLARKGKYLQEKAGHKSSYSPMCLTLQTRCMRIFLLDITHTCVNMNKIIQRGNPKSTI